MKNGQLIEGYICSMLLVLMTFFMIAEVFCRYFLGFSITWAEELIRYMFVWFIFLGASYCIPRSSHVTIDMFVLLFPKSWQKNMVFLGNIVWLVLSIIIIYWGGKYVLRLLKTGELTMAIKFPLWIVYASIPVGFAFMFFRLISQFYTNFKSNKSK